MLLKLRRKEEREWKKGRNWYLMMIYLFFSEAIKFIGWQYIA